ncbi:Uncharacterized protein DBV15_01738, partial [Temnothorax longispinosus]
NLFVIEKSSKCANKGSEEIHFSALNRPRDARRRRENRRNQVTRERNGPADRSLRVQEGGASNEARAGDQRTFIRKCPRIGPSFRASIVSEGSRGQDSRYGVHTRAITLGHGGRPPPPPSSCITTNGGDTLDLRFSRSRRDLTACTLLLKTTRESGETPRCGNVGNGGVLRSAKSRALAAEDVYHGCFIRIINVPIRDSGFFACWSKIRREITLGRDSVRIKGARPQYALSLLSTIRRGGRAELARAEPSDTELRTPRGEPLRSESSLRRPRIWILSRIGIPGCRRSRSRVRGPLAYTSVYVFRERLRKRKREDSFVTSEEIRIPQTHPVFTSPEGIPGF